MAQLFFPTALAIRTDADAVAFHRTLDIDAFNWEVKAGSYKYGNLSVEALPFARHRLLAREFNIKCLYVYYNPASKLSGCFWVRDDIDLEYAQISRWKTPDVDGWKEKISRWFPGLHIHVEDERRGNGSGDPFVIVGGAYLQTLLVPWQDEILRYVSSGGLLPGDEQ